MTGPVPLSPANLRAARGLLGWTQAQLAEAADVSVATVKRIEQGAEATPVVENALVAALRREGVALSPTPADLAEGVEACVALLRRTSPLV